MTVRMQTVGAPPRDRSALHRMLWSLLQISVPRQAVVAGHNAPFDYLAHAFFEGDAREASAGGADCIVWANRGGGKTYLGAVATLLDLVFKPGIQICILGGSMEQSSKMYRYLRTLIDGSAVRHRLAAPPTQRCIQLDNGSRVELLSQSERSVRGPRVHRLRCDEVEEFNPEIWQAAQLVTRSETIGERHIVGSVEALSTMHRPFGMMARLIDEAAASGRRVFRWCALDVIERCPPSRPCETCNLWNDCRGRAKEADGFIPVDDLVRQRMRTSDETWASEVMCQRPQRSACVYPRFDVERHVAKVEVNIGDEIIGGMDFGLRSPLVMLWARVRMREGRRCVEVFDEYVRENATLEQHLAAMAERPWRPKWIGVDPAGQQRNAQTGLTDIHVLREHGYRARWRASRINEGIESVRRRLDHGLLTIDPDCKQLIRAMSLYHFDVQRPDVDTPVKDGPDHLCDALRYMLINMDGSGAVTTRRW